MKIMQKNKWSCNIKQEKHNSKQTLTFFSRDYVTVGSICTIRMYIYEYIDENLQQVYGANFCLYKFLKEEYYERKNQKRVVAYFGIIDDNVSCSF